jgi:xylulokinase
VTTPALLAIDLGTTLAKAGLVGLDGRLLALARATYPLTTDGGTGAAEQDPSDWWAAIRAMTAELLALAGPVSIGAIGLDGQGPTLVAAGADGQPIGPALTWLDTRAAAEEAELAAGTGEAGWVLGILPRALWAERHRPAVAAAARWYLASWEWVGFRLTGVAAETTLPGQVHPDRAAVARTGLATDRIPARIPASTVLGPLQVGPAAELGLEPGTPVVAGMADAHASFLGAGLLEPGDAIDTGGTSGGFAVYTDRPVELPDVFGAAAPIPGRWFLGGAMNATGKALDWLREDVLHDTVTTDDLLAEAAAVRPGADGLVFLPYLAGERSPIWDAAARGAFVGLTLRHRRAHLARAVIEAADLALRHVAAPIVAAGIPVRELRVSGGLARDADWNRVKADVTGFPVAVPAIVETAMVGSAIVAGTGIGAFPDFAAGCRTIVRIEDRFAPDPAHRAVYDTLYSAYVELYPALRPSFRRLAELDRDGLA